MYVYIYIYIYIYTYIHICVCIYIYIYICCQREVEEVPRCARRIRPIKVARAPLNQASRANTSLGPGWIHPFSEIVLVGRPALPVLTLRVGRTPSPTHFHTRQRRTQTQRPCRASGLHRQRFARPPPLWKKVGVISEHIHIYIHIYVYVYVHIYIYICSYSIIPSSGAREIGLRMIISQGPSKGIGSSSSSSSSSDACGTSSLDSSSVGGIIATAPRLMAILLLHYTTLHYTTLHYTMLCYAILCYNVSISFHLG